MEIINQHAKKIMEGCKERARDAGLSFDEESLEYIVTNRDLLELSPKGMIPTLYDYWVHDVEVLKESGRYELYPSNPYETVINTRPAISYYNDNNPDWLNVMIFYHVLAHIDFFQNNLFFRHTWEDDFAGQALSDKRLIARLRAEKGRWVDYVIEFARSIDNLVGFHEKLASFSRPRGTKPTQLLDYYFDVFLQSEKKVSISEYVKEIKEYNSVIKNDEKRGEKNFFARVYKKYPELKELFKKSLREKSLKRYDLMQFLLERSAFLNKEENRWMKQVIHVVRNTSLFFQPQIRTKIMNEGWASYWHENLFLQDDRIKGHEVDFARVNAWVTAMPRVGLNPYALGMRLFYYLEEMADKGKISFDFQRLLETDKRNKFDSFQGEGRDFIFRVRENLCDFMFINSYIDQDFVTRNKLFVAGKFLNQQRMAWQYYVKSRKADDYRKMLLDSLYHPPHITVDHENTSEDRLSLKHHFEGKPLLREFIPNTMLGIEYLWNGMVELETSEVVPTPPVQKGRDFAGGPSAAPPAKDKPSKRKWRRVVYSIQDRKISKKILE